MDFAYSEDQLELRSTARSALASLVPAARLGELADSPEGWDPASLGRLGQLGWLGLAGDPEATFVDESVLLEEAGYALLPGPFWSTLALAAPALLAGGDAAADVFDAVAAGASSATLAWVEPGGPRSLLGALGADLATVAAPAGGGWVVTGEKLLVPDGAAVSHVVVVAGTAQGPGLFLVESERVGVRAVSTTDRTRRYAALTFAATPAVLLVGAHRAAEVIRVTRLRSLAALAVEAVVVGQRALDIAAAYAKEREQFGRVIGTYQGVSHRVADMYSQVELARSLALRAVWCVSEPHAVGVGEAEVAVAMAKAAATDAAVSACEGAIQVLGGMGITWEHVIHRFYKRALWAQAFDGPPRAQRAIVAAALLD